MSKRADPHRSQHQINSRKCAIPQNNPFVTGANKAEADAGDSADFSFNQG